MKRKTIISSIVIAGLGVVSSAGALPISQNAAEFHADNAADQAVLAYSTNGVSNTSAVRKDVIGTLARNPHASGNQQVTVVGFNADVETTTSCTVYAITETSDLLGFNAVAKSFVVTNHNHVWTRSLFFSTVDAGPNATYQVRCTLDPNGKSIIQGVRTAQ